MLMLLLTLLCFAFVNGEMSEFDFGDFDETEYMLDENDDFADYDEFDDIEEEDDEDDDEYDLTDNATTEEANNLVIDAERTLAKMASFPYSNEFM